MSLKDQIHILVVDDMSTSRGLISQALESIGVVNIHHAGSGTEAMQLLASQSVHLVLSDYNMPSMDGIELLRKLRSDTRTKAIGFILITGKADKSIIDSGKSLGMNNFIKKPFGTQDLKSCLEAVVGRL
ncbi:response regulator [Paracoccus aerodenitrificans]|uniref:response regulator n=1 Tax=Paracoccus aerodenitrificans TaxID=3017781 RepID=UPI0022F14139|nr:response regulator [Paracoccus aerodenitrificans]WBU62802.1 response regulator [Paracoccus aerodenitrificans]